MEISNRWLGECFGIWYFYWFYCGYINKRLEGTYCGWGFFIRVVYGVWGVFKILFRVRFFWGWSYYRIVYYLWYKEDLIYII